MDEGEKIRKIREIRDYKQEYIASQLDISIKAYSKLERGETKLTVDRLYEIAQILKVKPEEIIRFSEEQVFSNSGSSRGEKSTDRFLSERGMYKQQIRHLEGEISFLRKLLNRVSEALK